MATLKMQSVPMDVLNEDTPAYEFDSGDVVATTNWTEVPVAVQNLVFVLEVTSGEWRVEFSTSKLGDIRDGNAIVQPWALGDVTATANDSSVRFNAFRLVLVNAGTGRLIVNGK